MARTIVFAHVPKTAGTSIHRSLTSILGPEGCAPLYEGLPETLGDHRFVHTHHAFPDLEAIRGDKLYFTCVRSPIERLISMYRYFSSLTEFHAKANNLDYVLKAKAQTFEEFVMDGEFRLDNDLVRHFSGRQHPSQMLTASDLTTAIANLGKCAAIFSCAGLQAEFFVATGTRIATTNVSANNFKHNELAHEPAPTVDLDCLGTKGWLELQRLTAMDHVLYDAAIRMGVERGFGELRECLDELKNGDSSGERIV